jgi:hypothetical protein
MTTQAAIPAYSEATIESTPVSAAVAKLYSWIKERDGAGFEPFDLMNSPYFRGNWAKHFPFNVVIRHAGRRFVGLKTRRFLKVPASTNPKAIGLLLSGCCEMGRLEDGWRSEAETYKAKLLQLRSKGEEFFCWGYDWDAVSIRANVMPKFSPNAIATTFCADALLDMGLVFGDDEALDMARSAGEFMVRRLNRPVEKETELCFSYTPTDRTQIYNSSVVTAALLSRLGHLDHRQDYLALARRAMQYLVNAQLPDGSWYYGAGRWQRWIDSFHTGYNLDALLCYRDNSGDHSFDQAIEKGFRYFKQTFLLPDGAPKYFNKQTFPIDIHACSQAILTLSHFSEQEADALPLAMLSARWTLENMRDPRGFFYYQKHRTWTNRTPYMRWGQAWMFRALSRLQVVAARFDSTRAV